MLTGLVVALVAVAAWRRAFAGYPAPAAPGRALAPRELAFLAAAAEAIYPPGGELAPSGGEAGIPAYTDRYVSALPSRFRRLMRLLFFLMEHATIFLPAPPPRGWRRFSSLSLAQRVAVLEAWRGSRLFPRRLVFDSLRAILTLGYFAHPPVLRRLQLAPRAIVAPLCEADLLYPRVGEHPDTIPHRAADLSLQAPAPPLDIDAPLDPRYAEPRS